MKDWPSCLGDIDCQSGSPVPAGAYCDLEENQCLCRLFHQPINGSCQRVKCQTSDDCRVGSQGSQYQAWYWFTCTKDGSCQCQWPKVLHKGTACYESVWVKIIGGLILTAAIIFFVAYSIHCNITGCTTFFESHCRQPKGKLVSGPPGSANAAQQLS